MAQELFLYSAGLFPLLAHAAMNVRPALLTVYETHFVPLGQRLRPALNGFLSGVLPGLEEGSDHFDRYWYSPVRSVYVVVENDLLIAFLCLLKKRPVIKR